MHRGLGVFKDRKNVIAIGFALLLVIGAFALNQRPATLSVEVGFSEPSQSGLNIVPASGRSDPQPSCEADYFCRGVQRWYRSSSCSENLVATCSDRCAMGACVCSTRLFCSGDSLFRRLPNCNTQFVSDCENGCNSGACLPAGDLCNNIPGEQNEMPEHHVRTLGGECRLDYCPNDPGYQTISLSQCQNNCVAQYYCSGEELRYRSSACTDSLIQTCQFGCANGLCVGAPTASYDITVDKTLINSGGTVEVTWTATNVVTCSVRENNPSITDSWSGSSAGCSNNACSATQTSSNLEQQTRYTLTCRTLSGSEVEDSVVVNINPVFQEQ